MSGMASENRGSSGIDSVVYSSFSSGIGSVVVAVVVVMAVAVSCGSGNKNARRMLLTLLTSLKCLSTVCAIS
jgi:hypothetical protein